MINTKENIHDFFIKSNIIDIKILWNIFVYLILLIFILFLFPSLTPIIFIGLGIYSLFGINQSIQSILIAFLIKSLNSGLFNNIENFAKFHWIVLYVASIKILVVCLHKKIVPKKFLVQISSCYLVLFSISLFSLYPVISYLKLANFIFFSFSLVSGIHIVKKDVSYWLSWLFTLYLFVCTISLFLLGSPLGYFTKNGLFQGILDHPQLFGIFCSPFISLLVFQININKSNILIFYAIFIGIFSIFHSGTRTALLAVLASVITSIILFAIFKPNFLLRLQIHCRKQQLLYIFSIIIIILTSLSLSLFNLNETLLSPVNNFLNKGRYYESFDRLAEDSRGNVIEKSLNNFYNYPITGIGFGIPSDYEMFEIGEGIEGVPISVPTLKGSLPSAILEETGIIGTIAFILFLFSSIKYFIDNSNMSILSLYLSCFFVNLGEFNIFSFGGAGQYFWFFIAIAFAFASLNENFSK
ncbi:O-antigen ligase family protein [Anabaena sp. FACHB-709]|uniref:O-antigen ligase-related domain-containing protein n=2 Tax=Nostocaceae TaxID=1162 RepID=A0A1Z4KHN5_ANAVA|nr:MULTISPECIES: O-antigen ligase family protein [Nostocaceae]BAY68485.1 hypothetical protein NIES23_12710 [Trichormus variabilis NIES-23]HBW30534.1 hypothetical protein [Nostoc sp. UBA8866]MBD2171706.1 O-antigen ligase family protein [Anabaena cylindrica FACHB-318]MBD2264225.1 O-antigen ligase family protein [Anabaena sp. FACHB-709]MBD2273568.1 O-antigen ligase family protein [Nostoc sp. PCC 7120 = FACHB-418]